MLSVVKPDAIVAATVVVICCSEVHTVCVIEYNVKHHTLWSLDGIKVDQHTTKYLFSCLDAFDTWALLKILRIPYTHHVSNVEVRRTTGCSLLSHLLTNRRLRLFGHIARSSPHEDHHRALAACIRQVLPDWKRPVGRHSHTWLRAIEADLGPLNYGLSTAWRKATTRDEW